MAGKEIRTLEDVRRVVVGLTPEGKTAVVSDAPPVRTAGNIAALWATDYGESVVPGGDDPTPALREFLASVEGSTRLVVMLVPPAGTHSADTAPAAAAAPEQTDVIPTRGERRPGGWHATNTVDYIIQISGELWALFEEGETVLRPGDVLIQTGGIHAWENRSSVPAVAYCVNVGVPYAGDAG